MKKTFKDLRDRLQEQQQQAQDLKQRELDQQQQQAQDQLQQAEQQHQEDVANENYQKELDRISKKEIAIIQATGFGKVQSEDTNANNVPDVLEVSRLAGEQTKAAKDYQLKMADIQSKNTVALQKLQVEREKLQVDRDNQKNDLQIARENSKNRSSKSKSK
jgi:predicted kinase